MGLLRPGRRVDIVFPDQPEYPISVTILGEPRILPPTVELIDDELVPWRTKRLVKFYSDLGWRTVRVADLVMR